MKSINTKQGQQDMTWYQVIATCTAAIFVIGYMSLSGRPWIIEEFKYNWYMEMRFLILFVFLFALGAIALAVHSRSTDLLERVQRLKKFTKRKFGIYIGKTLDGAGVHLSDDLRTGHVHIIGSTGRGKTESVIFSWIASDLHRRKSPILIDGKGDPEIAERLKKFIARRRDQFPEKLRIVTFDIGNIEKSSVTNPLAKGSAQQITDRLFAAFEFGDPYYRDVQYRLALDVVRLLLESGEIVSFAKLYEVLTRDEVLSGLVGKSKNGALTRDLTRHLSESRKDREQRSSGLLSQLAPLATSEIAPLVNGKPNDPHYHSLCNHLLDKSDTKTVYFILLPTLKYQHIGHQLGKMFCQELGWAVSERERFARQDREFSPVFLDEFASFAYKGFTNILNKARSAQVALHLSHQTMGDLSQVSPDFAHSIFSNTNIKCAFGINDPDSAEHFASHFGTRTVKKHCCPV